MTDYPSSGERLAALIRRERLISGLTQQGLAERIGILQPRLARWETGRHPPSFEQLDRLLAYFGLRLRLDLEQRPDPEADGQQERVRLAGLTTEYGVETIVDGQLAAWLQGVPGKPRRIQIAVTPAQVITWLTLTWVVRYPVDEDLMTIFLPIGELAIQLVAQGGGLLNTSAGYVRLRVVEELPRTVRLCIQEEGEFIDRVEAQVIRLEALPENLQRPTL